MVLYNFQPRCCWLPFQIVALGQLHSRKTFENCQCSILRDNSLSDLLITVISILNNKIVWSYCKPETLVIHWFKPLFYFVYGFEFSHLFRIAQPDSGQQIIPPLEIIK